MPPNVGSRTRLVAAAGESLRKKGYEATKVREVAAAAHAPMGSFYFHFPGGKEELAAEAMRSGGAEFGSFLGQCLDGPGSLEDRVERLAIALAEDLERTRWERGCPVAATALETLGRSPILQQTTDDVLSGWASVLGARFVGEGVDDAMAVDLATNVISMLEGAELLARIRGDAEPLHRAGRALRTLTKEATA